MGYDNTRRLSWVKGNDVLLKATVYEKVEGGEQAVDLTVCDFVIATVNTRLAGDTQLQIEHALDTEQNNTIVLLLPHTLRAGNYDLEVKFGRGGYQSRSFDMRFDIVRRDSDANVTFGVIDGIQTANLRVDIGIVAQALVYGKSSYEMWKELEGNEDKTLQEYIDTVLDLNGLTARLNASEQARVLAEQGRVTAEADRVEAEDDRVLAETARNNAEEIRQTNEATRQDNESQRIIAEQNRINAESARVVAESGRVSAENQRQIDSAAAIDIATHPDYIGEDQYVYHYTNGVYVRTETFVGGKSAYQSYLDTTEDNPPMSEEEWSNYTMEFSRLRDKPTTIGGYGITDAKIDNGTVVLGTNSITPLVTSQKGAANGVAGLDESGKVPSAQLPSYVDDVIEYSSYAAFPDRGEAGKIYVSLANNKTYRWSGTTYVEISESLALGTTSKTAFRGDYGNTAYQHAVNRGRAFASGLYKITTNSEGHVTASTNVVKSDITGLGVQETLVSGENVKTINGQSILGGGNITIEGGSGGYEPPVGGIPKTDLASDVQTSLGKADTAIQDISGKQDKIDSTHKLSADLVEDGATNKSYTATEKTKLAGIASGAEVNVQANWNESNTSSDAYIQNKPADLAHIGDAQGSATIADFDPETDTVHITAQVLSSAAKAQARENIGAGTSNFSGSYNDLSNKPTIPTVPSNIVVGGTQGYTIAVVSSMPASPDANTIYLITGS